MQGDDLLFFHFFLVEKSIYSISQRFRGNGRSRRERSDNNSEAQPVTFKAR